MFRDSERIAALRAVVLLPPLDDEDVDHSNEDEDDGPEPGAAGPNLGGQHGQDAEGIDGPASTPSVKLASKPCAWLCPYSSASQC